MRAGLESMASQVASALVTGDNPSARVSETYEALCDVFRPLSKCDYLMDKGIQAKMREEDAITGIIFVRTIFVQKEKCSPILKSSLLRFGKCQEMSRMFMSTEQTFASAMNVIGVISSASFCR